MIKDLVVWIPIRTTLQSVTLIKVVVPDGNRVARTRRFRPPQLPRG